MSNYSFFALLCILLLSACINEYYVDTSIPIKNTANKMRTLEEAKQIALNAVNMLSDIDTRSSVDRNIADCHYIVSPVTKSIGKTDTLLYVFDYTDNNGFAVVSASTTTEPLLALIDQGSYESSKNNENGGFVIFMDMAERYVAESRAVNPDLPPIIIDRDRILEHVLDTIDIDVINPKVTVQWGQTGIEGIYAPNDIAGCSNIAMAQIMSYFAYPSSIVINYTGASISNLLLDWSEINKHKDRYTHYDCTANESAHEAISHLARQLGFWNNSIYGETSTGTPTSNVRSTFIQLGYTISDELTYTNSGVNESLNNDKIIFMEGWRLDGDTYHGHTWVVDGSVCYTILHETYWHYEFDPIWHPMGTSYEEIKTYLHINWGWDGNCNGYFLEGVFDTQRGKNDNVDLNYTPMLIASATR